MLYSPMSILMGTVIMLIILDRDGVINKESIAFIKSPAEWIPIPGSLAAIAKLNAAGHTVVVATNQSGVARGLYSLDMLDKIHQKMQNELAKEGGHIDAIFFCPHGPDDNCDCRKPKSGLFKQIAERYPIDFKNAIAVGDSLRDIQAAQAANCKAVLVETGNGKQTLLENPNLRKMIDIYANLAGFVKKII